ncbi:MAG: hypothetical protein V2I43_08800 [Parvularcula sp.]|jgi:hypothetical protein|nr:hypothetical protein [Parvularcula sp.]
MTQLYRHFDADGRLLYVGISLHAVARLAQHNLNSDWAQNISRVDVEKFANRTDAIRAEIKAIRDEKPLHNVNHSTRPPPPRKPNKACLIYVTEHEMGMGYVGGILPADLADEINALSDEYMAEAQRRVDACREEVEAAAEIELPRGRPPKK